MILFGPRPGDEKIKARLFHMGIGLQKDVKSFPPNETANTKYVRALVAK